MAKVKKLHKDGVLSESEFGALMKEKQARLMESEAEIQATIKADKATFVEGLALIELLENSYDFMKMSTDLLKKAHLAKSVLSNPILENGTLRFTYRKPFDVLIELTSRKNWWFHQESNLEQSFRKAPLYPFNYGTEPKCEAALAPTSSTTRESVQKPFCEKNFSQKARTAMRSSSVAKMNFTPTRYLNCSFESTLLSRL